MTIDIRELVRGEPLFTWVADDGTNIKIASTRLRNWVLLNQHTLEIFAVHVDIEMGTSWLSTGQCDPARVRGLNRRERREPIIFCKRPTFTDGKPDVFLVDGHHRYARAALDGDPLIECWLIEEKDWRPFQVVGGINITQEQLKSAPLRNYGSIRDEKA